MFNNIIWGDKNSMKSIRNKILISIILTVTISLLSVGAVTIFLNYKSTQRLLEQTIQETARISAERVSHELKEYLNIAYETGSIARLSSPTLTTAQKKAIVDQKAETYQFQRGNIIGLDGISLFDGKDYSEREYFQQSIKGEYCVSEPLISKITGELTIIISAPLWKDGIPNTAVVGVVYFVPTETFLNDIVSTVKISPGGGAQIINKKGSIIAHQDMEQVKNQVNSIELAKTDSAYKEIAKLESEMIQGKSGFGTYEMNGVHRFLAYAPIDDTDGWSIGVNAPMSEFMGGAIASIFITILLLIIAIVAACAIAIFVANKIASPIKQCAKRLSLMAQGDFSTPVPVSAAKDETKDLLNDLEQTVESISEVISDVSYHMGEIAKGNLTTEVTKSYQGDFIALETSTKQIISSLNATLGQINESSEQVASSSDQVASGAQALSQGATEQASAVEELASTIELINEHVKDNTANAEQASKRAKEAGDEVAVSNSHMQEMMTAISEISTKSNEIGKIIKTVEDIAFQTNILALNAAVEAARAGVAGKGFAVVADEVRNLASKSGEAVKNTTAMIEESIKAVENGIKIADETAQSMEKIVDTTKEVTAIVNKITEASKEQAQSIGQVTQGIDQIASVVQTNSATAEESAAASEQLSSEAQSMQTLVEKFHLKKSEYTQ